MKKYILFLLSTLLFSSCNEDKFLKEEALDFMSSDNSFTTVTDFNMSINNLYDLIRVEFYAYDENKPFDYLYGTDLIYDGEYGSVNRHSNMVAAYHPTSSIIQFHWDALFKIIAEANVVIDKVALSSISDEDKTMFTAKAKFFRGMAYRTLAYLYGNVPIVLNETTSVKNDYTLSSKEDVLQQAASDVLEAAQILPDITNVKDGEISSSAAYHLLAEIYLALGQNEEAEQAATKVIDNPALALMQNRFGSRMNELDRDGDGQPDGDVYWDLFRMNNQNRGAGNTEGIWVIQFETDLPGGGSSTADLKKKGNYLLERHISPLVSLVQLRVNDKIYSPFVYPVSDYTSGGRGIGWGVSTVYFSNTIWESDFNNDMRNSKFNFVRKFPVTNQTVRDELGIDTIDVENPPANLIVGTGGITTIPGNFLYAYQTKCTTPYNHPEPLYQDASTYLLKSIAGATYVDQYMFRLAETYLLRAEAYLNMNRKDLAAADINVVRNRAHASPVDASEVDLDYILDERMRELGIEEKRRLTLMRTGTLYDRVMKCNPYYANPETNGDGVGMLEKYNVWPIPQSVIEANTGAVIEQNPDYR